MSEVPEFGTEELRRLQEIGDLSNDQYKGDPNFMASLARGLEVLQAFKPQYSQMSVSEISQQTGIPRAAVRRCCIPYERWDSCIVPMGATIACCRVC